MAFLDNSGDIILDAVLTDTGRKQLAAGDGSFRIVKFAMGDDEIDYSLYRNSNSAEGRHASGSAYYDLNILQTPVLEAFTNNTAVVNSKLISYTRSDLLYLPVMKVNTKLSPSIDEYSNGLYASASVPVGGYIITADNATSNPATLQTAGASGESPLVVAAGAGVIRGAGASIQASENITIDQGLDTGELSVAMLAAGDPLRETQYLIEMDNRLGQVMGMDATTLARPSFVDDDNVASYYISLNSNPEYFAISGVRGDAMATAVPPFVVDMGNIDSPADPNTMIGTTQGGRYGTRLAFRVRASDDIQTSTTLFTKIGGTTAANYLAAGAGVTFYYIESMIRITGFTTGYRLEIPVRYLKKV
jgi:hypothetical protein